MALTRVKELTEEDMLEALSEVEEGWACRGEHEVY